MVVADQIVDRTSGRKDTFYDGPITTHVSFADPYCPQLRPIADRCAANARHQDARNAARSSSFRARASRRAPNRSGSQQPGWEVINMTQYPECYLARELEMCYVNISLITDYDVGLEGQTASSRFRTRKSSKVFTSNNERVKERDLQDHRNDAGRAHVRVRSARSGARGPEPAACATARRRSLGVPAGVRAAGAQSVDARCCRCSCGRIGVLRRAVGGSGDGARRASPAASRQFLVFLLDSFALRRFADHRRRAWRPRPRLVRRTAGARRAARAATFCSPPSGSISHLHRVLCRQHRRRLRRLMPARRSPCTSSSTRSRRRRSAASPAARRCRSRSIACAVSYLATLLVVVVSIAAYVLIGYTLTGYVIGTGLVGYGIVAELIGAVFRSIAIAYIALILARAYNDVSYGRY